MKQIELAKLLDVDPITIWRWIKAGDAPFHAKMTALVLNMKGDLPEIPEYLKMEHEKNQKPIS